MKMAVVQMRSSGFSLSDQLSHPLASRPEQAHLFSIPVRSARDGIADAVEGASDNLFGKLLVVTLVGTVDDSCDILLLPGADIVEKRG